MSDLDELAHAAKTHRKADVAEDDSTAVGMAFGAGMAFGFLFSYLPLTIAMYIFFLELIKNWIAR